MGFIARGVLHDPSSGGKDGDAIRVRLYFDILMKEVSVVKIGVNGLCRDPKRKGTSCDVWNAWYFDGGICVD